MKVGVMACAGRMGRAVMREVLEHSDLVLCGGVERPDHPELGQDIGALAGVEPLGTAAVADAALVMRGCDVVVEFSTAEASVEHARLAAQIGRPLVLGTTGFDGADEQVLAEAARRIPIMWAANMSVGINLLLGLVEQVAGILDDGFDVEIVEMHHRHKVDAPSGTALALGRAAAAGRGVDLDEVAERGRDGLTGARRRGDIGFAALRGGDVVGDHSVLFAGEGERLILTHIASDRAIYARGAVRAARWIASGKRPGLYGMRDVLGLT